MRTIRVLLAGLVGALALVALSPTPSYACSCALSDTEAFVGFADVVMVGTIDDRDPPLAGRTTDPAVYTVSVDRVLKGQAAPVVAVLSPDSGASCGLEGIELGQRYVVFAAHRDLMGKDSDQLWAILCGGTAPATDAFVADVQGFTGSGGPPAGGSAAYESDLTVTLDDAGGPVGGDWGGPLALAAGGALLLLTGAQWLRLHQAG